MTERIELSMGEEHAVKLPVLPEGASWTHEVDGMRFVVDVRKLWTSAPYPKDDDEDAPQPEPYMVFVIRAANPGAATVRFVPRGEGVELPQSHVVEVAVRGTR